MSGAIIREGGDYLSEYAFIRKSTLMYNIRTFINYITKRLCP